MTTTTAKRTTTKTCDKCGATGLTWKKSTRTGRWYLSEECMKRGYTGRMFRSSQPHNLSCPEAKPRQPLNTWQAEAADRGSIYGCPEGPVEDPSTHEHRWLPWRKAPGGITGAWCQGCRGLMVD
jgi:hypothetical protein